MERRHKDPGLFVSEEAMIAPDPLTEEAIDRADLEDDEETAGVLSPVTSLDDPREGTRASEA